MNRIILIKQCTNCPNFMFNQMHKEYKINPYKCKLGVWGDKTYTDIPKEIPVSCPLEKEAK